MRKQTLLILLVLLLVITSGCADLIAEIMASAKVKREAETAGSITFCPDERPYRVGGYTGACVDEDGLSEYTGIKLHGTEDEEKAFVKTTKSLQKGQDKECPKETPYYVSGFLGFGGRCVSKSDFNQYLSSGNIPDDEETKETEETKSCEYDSDCEPICEGDVMWKRGCNPRTNKCENTFDTDCSTSKVTVGSKVYSKSCANGACTTDAIKEQLLALKTEKSDQVKALIAKKQTAQQVMMDANKKCINGLAEVTNKLIIDTGLSLASPAKKLADVASDVTNSLLDNMVDDSKRMNAEEFIALNCKLYESLKNDIRIIENKIDKLAKEAEEINAELKKL
jgi:hypothetical protein